MGKRYWEWTPTFEIKPEETALLVIDMQKGFVEEGAPLEVPNARAQLPAIAKFAAFCRMKKIPVFFSRFAYTKDKTYEFYYKMAPQRGLPQDERGNAFEPENPETDICPELAPLPCDIVFDKYGYDCFAHSSLRELFDARGIKTVIICGTVVNWCVDSTIRSAYHQDYNVVVLADGVSGCDQAGISGDTWQAIELDHFAEAFARVATTETLICEI